MKCQEAIWPLICNEGLTYTTYTPHVRYCPAADSLLKYSTHTPFHPCLSPFPTSPGLELKGPILPQAWEAAVKGHIAESPPRQNSALNLSPRGSCQRSCLAGLFYWYVWPSVADLANKP